MFNIKILIPVLHLQLQTCLLRAEGKGGYDTDTVSYLT